MASINRDSYFDLGGFKKLLSFVFAGRPCWEKSVLWPTLIGASVVALENSKNELKICSASMVMVPISELVFFIIVVTLIST